MQWGRCIAVAVAQVLAVTVGEALVATGQAVRVLALGDSLTAGYYDGGQKWHPYAPVLAESLGCAVDYIGLSGWTTWGLNEQKANSALGVDDKGRQLDGLDTTLLRALHEGRPYTHVAILAGTNDLWHVKENGIERTLTNLRALHTTAHQRGAVTLALTVPELHAQSWTPDIAEARKEVNAWLHSYAQSQHGRTRVVEIDQVCPMFDIPEDVKRRRWEDDGIHFTPFGSEEIAAAVFAVLTEDSSVVAACPGAAG